MARIKKQGPTRPGLLCRGLLPVLVWCCCAALPLWPQAAMGAAPAQATDGEKTPAAAAPADAPQGKAPAAGQAAPTAADTAAAPTEVTELWTGSIFSSTYRVGVCFSAAGAVRGVVHLRLRNGQVDVYHITGSVKDNVVKARHSSGHSFEGRLTAADRVEGVIRLKNGLRLDVEGRRVQGVPLTGGDCSPPAAE